MKIKRIIKNLLGKIERYIAGRSNHNMTEYLKKQGLVIGSSNRFLCTIYSFGSEPYLIEIGDNNLFSDNLHFHTHDGGVKVLNGAGYFNGNRMDKMGRIKIGSNCFIGSGVHIMPGVSIGDNCIIGACSVVTKDVPDNAVVAGMPAKVICNIDEYFEKNNARGSFYPTPGMEANEKRKYLSEHVK